MAVLLFAGIPVQDHTAALAWYERLLGTPPTYVASDTEAVWELAENRSFAVEHLPGHAGHARHTVFLGGPRDLDSFVERAIAAGVTPVRRETYGNGVRKVTFRDPDGNEIGFGAPPE